MTTSDAPVLQVRDLRTHLFTRAGVVKAVDGVSFDVAAGEALGLVGESGSGKSMTCLSLVRLLPKPAGRTVGGEILLNGVDLMRLSPSRMRQLRGREIAMILQDHLMSLNPVYSIGDQVAEPFMLDGVPRSKRLRHVVEVLQRVRIPAAAERVHDYPFQFSGGMRQRVVAAMAIARKPSVLIADEPTTALDVTVQDQFLRLLKSMQLENDMAMVFVTHDLGVVAEICDRVAVMYAGRIVEVGPIERIFARPAHPYTAALIEALPHLDEPRRRRLHQIEGEPPNPMKLPNGCAFAPRCPQAMPRCTQEFPPTFDVPGGGQAACWLHDPTDLEPHPPLESTDKDGAES